MTENWDVLCSLYLRDWSDRYSNWTFMTVFGEVTDTRDLAVIIKEDRLPPRSIGIFLHEVTHHLVFDSLIGHRLGMLERSVRRIAFPFPSAAHIPKPFVSVIIEAQLRLNVAADMLKPLNEGLALFAEHDCYDFSAPLLSMGLMRAYQMFRGVKQTIESKTEEDCRTLNVVLFDYRHFGRGLRRKTDLLLQPLTPVRSETVHGGLAAYLFLKQAFIKACRNHEAFYCADFFLAYTQWFFFDDMNLATLLVIPSVDTVDIAEMARTIAIYIRSRFHKFVQSFTHASVDEFLKQRREMKPEHSRVSSDRELMTILSLPVPVRREGQSTVAEVNGEKVKFSIPFPGTNPEAEGRYEYFMSPRQGYEGGALYVRGAVIGVKIESDRAAEIAARVFPAHINREESKAKDDAERDHLTAILGSLKESNVLSEANRLLLAEIEQIYTTMANFLVRAGPVNQTRRLMRDRGLLPVFGGDQGLLERYVRLSAYSAIVRQKDDIGDGLAKENIDLEKLLRDLDRCAKASGFVAYVELSNGSFYCTA